MTDPLRDKRFPDRPQHPDFWKLVEVVNHLDGEAGEGGRSADDIIRDDIDEASLVYMAQQRAMRGRMIGGANVVGMTTCWIDGFLAGVRFANDVG